MDENKELPIAPNHFVHVFKRNKEDHIKFLSEQDKKHMRIIAILKMAKEGCIDAIMNHAFSEKFKFDEENQTAIYEIRLIQERRKPIYADS